MKILSIGRFSADGISNTCLHRNWALHKLADVDEVDSTLRYGIIFRIINRLFVKYKLNIHFPCAKLNKEICHKVSNNNYDVVWIDKGIFVSAETLSYIKLNSKSTIIGYSPDNMVERHNQSQDFLDSLPFYDYYVTTKSYIVEDLKQMGAKNVIFVNNAYEPTFHHPYEISEDDKLRLGGKVGFIGMWEKERCDSIIYLAQHGVHVRVWGAGKWLEYKGKYDNLQVEDTALFSEDYNKALSAFDISLCFLRKMNSDLQTTRTMEIPACKSLLMAERTIEHEQLFKDGEEAAFFSSNEELLEKCEFYLNHKEECKRVSYNGYKRCVSAGYSNEEMVKNVFIKVGLL